MSNCLIVNNTIRELASQMPGEIEQSVITLISSWQASNNKSPEEYPTLEELTAYKDKIRNTAINSEGFLTERGKTLLSTTFDKSKFNEGTTAVSLYPGTTGPTLRIDFTSPTTGKSAFVVYGGTNRKIWDLFNSAGSDVTNVNDSRYWENVKKIVPKEIFDLVESGKYLELYNEKSETLYGGAVVRPKLYDFFEEHYGVLIQSNSSEFNYKQVMKALELKKKGNTQSSVTSAENTTEKTSEEQTPIVVNAKASNTPIVSLSEQNSIDLAFDPITRRNRVSYIARLFSDQIDKALNTEREALQARVQDASEEDRLALETELKRLDRITILDNLTPRVLFNRVLDIFNNYVNRDEEDMVMDELAVINSMKGADAISYEKKYAEARKRALHKKEAYEKIIDNFKALAEEASPIINFTENIKIDPNYISRKNTTEIDEGYNEGEEEFDDNDDENYKKESAKDGWMTNYREVSFSASLSQAVRKVLSQVPRLNQKGFYDKDDLNNTIFLDSNYVHAVLLDKLRHMTSSDELIPMLEELSKSKTWVKQIVNLLKSDPELLTKFYSDFRKDFTNFWVQKKKLKADGTYEYQTITINRPEGVYYLLDAWRDNHMAGRILDDDSIYDNEGNISIEKANKGLEIVKDLQNIFNNLETQESLAKLEEQEIFNKIEKALHMLGIDISSSVLKTALTNIKESKGIKYTDPIKLLLPQLNIIYKGIAESSEEDATIHETETKKDLINNYGGAFTNIALLVAEVTEDAIESSVAETIDGKTKTYYGHVTPNYLGKLISRLKNVSENKEKFDAFMQEEFKQYEWFFKNNKWRNTILEQLADKSEIRKMLDHKVLLASDRVSYINWDSLDYTLALFTEYWGVSDDKKAGTKWAWYHVPILADSPSAEFIKFIRYTNKSIMNAEGRYLTYQEIITDKFIDLINQEWDRIMLVRERDTLLQKGDTSIKHIANYDIIRNKDGSIKNIGGAEFKFLPRLNTYKTSKGTLFIEELENIIKSGNGTELNNFLSNVINDIIEESFEEDYAKWYEIGVFEENENGKCINIPFIGQSEINKATAKALNSTKSYLGTSWTREMSQLTTLFEKNLPISDIFASRVFEEINTKLEDLVKTNILSRKDADAIKSKLRIKNNAKEALREYYWNSKLFTSQIIQVTTTDLAFYSSMEDFQKRYKEIHAPAIKLNTRAEYNGEVVGREWEKTIYLADNEIASTVVEDIKQVILSKYEAGELTEYNAASILAKYGYSNHEIDGKEYTKVGSTMIKTSSVNVADAQAYRSISSYRAMMVMAGKWDASMETAYTNLKNGNWSMVDFNTIWQTVKPFVYTQVNNQSGVEGHTGIKTPVQHKNSEFLLLAMHQLIAGPFGKSSKLLAINEFMEENGIDVVQFESTTKVGKQGVIDINHFTNKKQLKDFLGRVTGVTSGQENPDVLHKVRYEDYGIQTETPEHGIDAVQLVGTQIRKLITADIADDVVIEIEGKKLTKKEWLDLYNEINTENILQSFLQVDKIFKDKKEIEKILLDTMRGNPRYGIEMMRACTLDENGNFNIPLYDPVITQRIQSLLNSIIRSRITKQKIRGGALIQVSSYGLSDDLKIVFEGEGKNKRIKYMECYMPAYSREFYEPLMDPKTGQLDVEKLPEDLRKLIGYRVPTEEKYSMAPLYIKGFLPQQNGSAIMLPAEITTIAGSDFDVDKLYIMLPEFSIEKYDYIQAKKDFKAESKIIDESKDLIDSLLQALDYSEEYDTTPEKFKDWFEKHKEKYLLDEPKIKKIKYNHKLSAKENGTKARNNLLIDLMWGVLTNSDTASKILNPGGFDNLKAVDRIMTLLTSMSKAELKKQLDISRDSDIIVKLSKMDLNELNSLAKRFKKQLDPLSPTTQVYFHQQNMTGGKLIGIYANHNANHALMQHIKELKLHDKEGAFTLNNKKLIYLNSIKNEEGDFISRNNAGYLAASVDNVKDTVLAGLNQNTFTADASMLLSRLGYTPLEVGLLMNQPIIKDIVKLYARENRKGVSKEDVIKKVIKKYAGSSISQDNVLTGRSFTLEELAENIMNEQLIHNITNSSQTEDYGLVSYYERQVAVGYLFMKINKSAEALSRLVQITRVDTGDGCVGSNIAETITKIQKAQDFLEDASKPKFPIVNARVIRDNIDLTLDEDALRQELLNSPLPFLQAFYTLGLRQSETFLKGVFPYYNDTFNSVVSFIKDNIAKDKRLPAKTINSIYNDLLAYIMGDLEFFGSDKETSSSERRSYFINEFPKEFQRILEENPDIASIEFIKRLKFRKANRNNPVDTIEFKNVGHLNDILRERFTRDWSFLLYSNNPEAQKLALNLFRYCYYRNGFAFGPGTFIHLSPVSLRKAIPRYVDKLEKLLSEDAGYYEFIEQYVYNHLDDRALVPEIPEDTTVKFETSDSEVKTEINIEIHRDSNTADKKFIKEVIDENDYVFREFIGKRLKGTIMYYKLKETTSTTAVYTKIEPLGLKANFLEYEFGKDVAEMSSVVGIYNTESELSKKDKIAKERALASVEDLNTASDTEYTPTPNSWEGAYEIEAFAEAADIIYGGAFRREAMGEKNKSSEAFTEDSANTSFKDANDEIICGNNVVKTF